MHIIVLNIKKNLFACTVLLVFFFASELEIGKIEITCALRVCFCRPFTEVQLIVGRVLFVQGISIILHVCVMASNEISIRTDRGTYVGGDTIYG